ncbi:hypothetical protein HYU17_02745 [Candidatus Woesearchaeota archaeon]|nr:hypothetical protein [Candidatus Woesearchaeota archaeon]
MTSNEQPNLDNLPLDELIKRQLEERRGQTQQEPEKQEADSTAKLSPADYELSVRIRQIEEETKGEKPQLRRERILALLLPRLGGKKPEALIKVCYLPPGYEYHTYYAEAAEKTAALPDPKVLPPHLAEIFTMGDLEPCLTHTIELSIGVMGALVSQKKVIPYELLPGWAKNQQELERLVTAATDDYALVGKEMLLPTHLRAAANEWRRKVAAVVFHNAEFYKSKETRQEIVQLLQQIDNAITLQKEGKASEEDMKALIARLREKPRAPDATASEHYLQEMYFVPAKLKNPDWINQFLRRLNQPYEVIEKEPGNFSSFRFKTGYTATAASATAAVENIIWLETAISMLKGLESEEKQKHQIGQLMPEMYRRFQQPGERQQTL